MGEKRLTLNKSNKQLEAEINRLRDRPTELERRCGDLRREMNRYREALETIQRMTGPGSHIRNIVDEALKDG